MTQEENKAVIRRLFEAENKRNLALLDELIAPDFVEERNTPFELRGPEGYKQFVTTLFKAFPDLHETIEDVVAEGDKVCVHMEATATHIGEWNFMPQVIKQELGECGAGHRVGGSRKWLGREPRTGRLLGAVYVCVPVGEGGKKGSDHRGFGSLTNPGWRMPMKGRLRYCPL